MSLRLSSRMKRPDKFVEKQYRTRRLSVPHRDCRGSLRRRAAKVAEPAPVTEARRRLEAVAPAGVGTGETTHRRVSRPRRLAPATVSGTRTRRPGHVMPIPFDRFGIAPVPSFRPERSGEPESRATQSGGRTPGRRRRFARSWTPGLGCASPGVTHWCRRAPASQLVGSLVAHPQVAPSRLRTKDKAPRGASRGAWSDPLVGRVFGGPVTSRSRYCRSRP